MQTKPALSKSKLRGTLLFVLILVLIFVLPDLITHFSEKEKYHIRYSDVKTQQAVQTVKRNKKQYFRSRKKKERYSVPDKAFDPNTYTVEQWMALGLSEKQAAVVLKFTKYGIHSNDDLKKIFVISDELFELIKDSTFYPERTKPNYENRYPQPSFAEKPKVNVNTATIAEMDSVWGVSAFYAKKIIERRDMLGGYYDESQLLEIWKMDEEKVAKLAPKLLFDQSKLKRININTATTEELKLHPYISWNLANSIVKLRSQIGRYNRVEDVKKSVLMTDELYEKLKRYLTVE
ncbi:MAG TPA: helix-hairpin-helix domain-containing protein [Fluviicola sp.]|nr:helix-hairpin-helix domain-containing protein [Fluviicola sp.]